MFWLAVIGGSMILLHAILLFILKSRKGNTEKQRDYGALTLPRFEIFLAFLALPCICVASASLVRGTLQFHFSFFNLSFQLLSCYLSKQIVYIMIMHLTTAAYTAVY